MGERPIQLPSRALVTYQGQRGVFLRTSASGEASPSAQPPYRFIPVRILSEDDRKRKVDATVAEADVAEMGSVVLQSLGALHAMVKWDREQREQRDSRADAAPRPAQPPASKGVMRMSSLLRSRRVGRASNPAVQPEAGAVGRGERAASRDGAAQAQQQSDASGVSAIGVAVKTPSTNSIRGRNLLKKAVSQVGATTATKASLEEKHSEHKRLLRALRSFIVYLIFLACYLFAVFHTRSVDDFWSNEATRRLFIERPFRSDVNETLHEDTFHDITFLPELHSWLQGRFAELIFSEELGSQMRALHGYNHILGPVRLRQLRVEADSCKVPEAFARLIDGCWAPYSFTHHSEVPFGPSYSDGPNGTEYKYSYSTSSELDGLAFPGRFGLYSGGGFVVDLPTNLSGTLHTLRDLESDRWLDKASRALFVDFSTYNANVHHLATVRLLFEMPASGGIVPSAVLRVQRPLTYKTHDDFVRLGFEIVAFSFMVFSLLRMIKRVRERQLKRHRERAQIKEGARAREREATMLEAHAGGIHAKSKPSIIWQRWRKLAMVRETIQYSVIQHPYHAFDWVNQGLFWAALALRIYTVRETYRIFERLETATDDEYVNLQPLSYQIQQEFNINAVNCFFFIMKGFKYLALVPQLDVLFITIKKARLDLFFFFILFTTVLLGYAVAFHVAVGSDLEEYRTLGLSCLALLQLMLGIFDYDALHRSAPVMAPILFCSYVVLIVFVLANIFLAIVNDAFATVILEDNSKRGEIFGAMRGLFYQHVLGLSPMQAMLGDIERSGVDQNCDGKLEPGELEHMLRATKLHGHLTVKGLLEEFDTNGDGIISGAEVTRLNQRVLKAKRNIDLQLAAQLEPRVRKRVRDTFLAYDPDMTRSLDTVELEDAVNSLGYKLTPTQLHVLIQEFDYDRSGTLDLLEFTAMMARMLGYKEVPNEQLEMLEQIFDFLDANQNGTLSLEEIAVGIDKLGLVVSDKQLRAYVNEFDSDFDERITKEEWYSLVAKIEGTQGATVNPRVVSKELEMTVTKLEEMVDANEQKMRHALDALLAQARSKLANGGEHWRTKSAPPQVLQQVPQQVPRVTQVPHAPHAPHAPQVPQGPLLVERRPPSFACASGRGGAARAVVTKPAPSSPRRHRRRRTHQPLAKSASAVPPAGGMQALCGPPQIRQLEGYGVQQHGTCMVRPTDSTPMSRPGRRHGGRALEASPSEPYSSRINSCGTGTYRTEITYGGDDFSEIGASPRHQDLDMLDC